MHEEYWGLEEKPFENTPDPRFLYYSREHEEGLKIFDPFFTTKETGERIGLGLSISHGIIEKHQGTMEVRIQKGKGATFVIRLPVVEKAR